MAVGNKFAELQGLNYVPNDAYLQEGFTGSEPLDFSNISSSGIMSQYPYIYPPINQGGDDGPIDPGSKNYGYKSSYASTGTTPGENENYLNDIEEGTIDEEDDKKRSLSIMDMVRAGGAFMLGGPLHSINSLRRSNNRNKQKEMEKIEAQYGPGDPGLRGNDDTPGFGKDAQGNFTNQFEGGDPGVNMADGGRAGYFFGGRVNYKAGGRINFRGGGMDMGNEANQAQSAAMGNSTSAPGPGDTGGEGGNNPSDDSDKQFGGGNNNDGNNNPPPINKTSIIDKIRYNPIINNPLTRLVGRVGMYSVNPSLMGLDYRTASQLKGVYDKATDEVDEDDVTLNKYKQGGRVSFKNGGLAGLL